MANLAKAAVALYPTTISTAEFYADKHALVYRRLKLTLTGQGGQTNTIPARSLGFSLMVRCSNLWDAQNSKGYPAVVDPVNNVVILLDGAAAPAPVDVTSNAAYITVLGVLDTVASLT